MLKKKFSYHFLIFFASLFIVSFFNHIFFSSLLEIFPFYKVASTWAFMLFALCLCFELLCFGRICKAILICFVLYCSFVAYFIETLNIGITPDIIQSFLNTHISEAKSFLTPSFIGYISFLGVLPSILIFFFPASYSRFVKELILKLSLMVLYACLSFVLWSFVVGQDLIYLFTTQHKFQHITLPISPIRSSIMLYTQKQKLSIPYQQVALDATLANSSKKKILVLVIGESVRASELQDYSRNLLPQTKSHFNLVNFSNFSSCGVITAISVPCMLTPYTHSTYTNRYLSNFTDNILDITQRVGIKTYWLDSNSGDAQSCIGGVCKRIENVFYFDDLDEALFKKFDSLTHHLSVDSNYLFVLHTFGSHGPDYFRRYPKEFEIYTPVCKEKNPNLCTKEKLINAYDNSILYTDFLLHSAILRLEELQKEFDVSLWYISDHGESLGELGNYMHGGLPYSLAPKNQTLVGALAWFGNNLGVQYQAFKSKQNSELSQDFIFHSILGFFKINTKVYDQSLDLGH
ncbi:sulfatase-like hydrolase/transferase [uncultured Helicobacter sp.]|uniref:phosphoethanolamine transferase n=1 Tax=uncultured Helicobacter sp. TaxID=175537 RepID=UPI0034331C4E